MLKNKGDSVEYTDLYEYVFIPIPINKKRNTRNLFAVIIGYVVALSGFSIGARMGESLPFWQAFLASFLGNGLLFLLGTAMGLIAFRTGWSSTFLARRVLGKKAAGIYALGIISLCIHWIGVNGDWFARTVVTVFPDWGIPVPVTAVGSIILWTALAKKGWKGMERVGRNIVPFITVAVLGAILYIFIKTEGFSFIGSFVPSGKLSFQTAVALVIGNSIFGCMITPDVYRFARTRRRVVFAQIPSYFLGLLIFNLCGILVGQAGGSAEFGVAATRLGLGIPMLICIVLCMGITENNSIYSASLAAQNCFQGTGIEGNLSHRSIAFIISGLAMVYAAMGVSKYAFTIIEQMAFLLVPLAGMIIGEFLFVKKSEENKNVNLSAILIWGLGILAGYAGKKYDVFMSPLIAAAVSLVAYVGVYEMKQKREAI